MKPKGKSLLLLLGSGISYPSFDDGKGGDNPASVRALTNAILNESWVYSAQNEFRPQSAGIRELAGREGTAATVQKFLRLLKASHALGNQGAGFA